MQTKKPISRREFLKMAGVAAGATLLAACTPQIQTVVITQPAQLQTQVVTSVVTQQVTQQVEITSTPLPSTGPVVNATTKGAITFWGHWASPVRKTAVLRLIAIVNKTLPDVTVNYVYKPFGDLWTAVIAAVASGTGMPDVFIEDRPNLPNRAANGVDMDLQPLITRDKLDPGVFWPFTWQQTLYKGDSYGIPFETDVRVLWYDQTQWTDAGLDPANPPKTWDDIAAAADKLDVKDTSGKYSRVAFMPYGMGNVSPTIWAYTEGINLPSADGSSVNVQQPEFVDVLTWIKSWIDRYGGLTKYQTYQGTFGSPPNDAFMSGGVSTDPDIGGYESQLNFYRPQVPIKGKKTNMVWGATLLPYKKQAASWSGGFAMSIPTGAANQEAAWEFIKVATGYDANVSWGRDTQAMPTYQAAAEDSILVSDPWWAADVAAMKVSTGGIYVPKYPGWENELNNRYNDMFSGKTTIAQGLSDAQDAINAAIAKAG
jgi:multiple sugar transport system substrate-binding protein